VGGLCVCAVGLGIIKLPKPPLIYSVLRSNMGGLRALFGEAKPNKAPRGDGTGTTLLVSFTPAVTTSYHVHADAHLLYFPGYKSNC